MTYRDLIVYILQNHLEDEEVFKDGKLAGFMTIDEAAISMNVDIATIIAMIALGQLNFVTVGDLYLIPTPS